MSQDKKNKVVYGSVKNKITASDLIEERKSKNFKSEFLLHDLGLYHYSHLRDSLDKIMAADPIMRNTHKFYELSPAELQTY